MKLLISLLVAGCAWYLAQEVRALSEKASRPSSDFITQCLRKGMEKWISQDVPWLSHYVRHLNAISKEVPFPKGMDMPLFLALHAVAGLPLWLLLAVAIPSKAIWGLPFCLLVGAALSYGWLKYKQGKFHTALLKALPDWLELQALVMEAGLDLTAGLQHYLSQGPSSPLQPMLRDVQKEIKMGRSRSEAFSTLAHRTSFAPLRETCRSILQALAQGTSLAPLLRNQAAVLRTQRMRIAEKKAAEAPLKMLFPLFVFIFPTIFIVLLGPMALMFAHGGF